MKKRKGYPDIVCVMPVHGRQQITTESALRLIKYQKKVNVKVIMIGDETNIWAKDIHEDVVFLKMPNKPIYRKIEKGVELAGKFSPDGIMYVGSDDWFSDNWLKYCLNYKWMAAKQLNIYNIFTGKFYTTTGLYCDSGEFVSKNILEKINWKAKEIEDDKHHGVGRKKVFESQGFKRGRSNSLLIMQVIGPWQSYHTMETFEKMYGLVEINPKIKYRFTSFDISLKRLERGF